MKFTKGKNWWQFNITKNKLVYYGPKSHQDKHNDVESKEVVLRAGTRRVKIIVEYNKETKIWAIHFGGCFQKNFPKNIHVDHQIMFWDPENKCYKSNLS